MTLPTSKPRHMAFLLPGLLVACVDAASCDPNAVGNVLTSAACSASGSFDTRQDNLRSNLGTIQAEVERERIALSRANTRIRELRRAQALSSTQLGTLNQEIAALNGDIDRLSRSAGNPAQAAQARQRIAARQPTINAVAGRPVF